MPWCDDEDEDYWCYRCYECICDDCIGDSGCCCNSNRGGCDCGWENCTCEDDSGEDTIENEFKE